MTGKPGSQWPLDKQELLRELDAKELSLKEMARRIGCSEHTISRQRRHLGLPVRPSPISVQPEPREPATQRFHRGASTLPPLASLTGDER